MAINFTKSIEVFGGVVWSETIRCSDQKFADAFAYLLNKKCPTSSIFFLTRKLRNNFKIITRQRTRIHTTTSERHFPFRIFSAIWLSMWQWREAYLVELIERDSQQCTSCPSSKMYESRYYTYVYMSTIFVKKNSIASFFSLRKSIKYFIVLIYLDRNCSIYTKNRTADKSEAQPLYDRRTLLARSVMFWVGLNVRNM